MFANIYMVFIIRIFQISMTELQPNEFDRFCDEQFAQWFKTYASCLWTKIKLFKCCTDFK